MTDPGRNRGLFITLEGPDGAGKSSQLGPLAEHVRKLGHECVATREPGSTEIGERVRDVVLQGGMREALTDALLFNAARRQHVQEIIRPALESGAVVICDRYADSSMAYQGYGGGVPLDDVQTINFLATSGLSPDRTVLFDLPVEAGLQRRAVGAASDFTRFESTEQHDVAFHQRVRDGYLEMAAADPARWRVIDAGQPSAEVAEALWQAVRDLIES
jgi:dTMP kinase